MCTAHTSFTLIHFPQVIDNHSVHGDHEKERDDEQDDVKKDGEAFLQGVIGPDFATFPASYRIESHKEERFRLFIYWNCCVFNFDCSYLLLPFKFQIYPPTPWVYKRMTRGRDDFPKPLYRRNVLWES